jgi:hypothetical protein
MIIKPSSLLFGIIVAGLSLILFKAGFETNSIKFWIIYLMMLFFIICYGEAVKQDK